MVIFNYSVKAFIELMVIITIIILALFFMGETIYELVVF